MTVSRQQDIVIDAMLATHRELVPCDLVEYTVTAGGAGGIILTIKSGEYWYRYHIQKSGAVQHAQKSDDNIVYHPLKFFCI